MLKPEALVSAVSAPQFSADLAECGSQPHAPPSIADAKRLLACKFQLPFEKTLLSQLFTADDPQYFARLLGNRNLPSYLKALPGYYQNVQGAKRSSTHPSVP